MKAGFIQTLASWLILFILCLAFILIASGGFSYDALFVSVLSSAVVLFLSRAQAAQSFFRLKSIFIRPIAFFVMIYIFFRELTLAAIGIAMMLFKRNIDLYPGIVAVPLATTDDLEIVVFASLITMVPGTLVLDISGDRRTLYMHVLDVRDEGDARIGLHGQLRDYVKRDFERHVIRTFE